MTVEVEPALTTLRPDPDWTPPGTDAPPRGRISVVAVGVTVLADGVRVGSQVGSQHIVVLDGAAYGFAPCPA